MSIHPIQGFKAMSPAKKAATITATVAGVGATALVIASAIKGKNAVSADGAKLGFFKKVGIGAGMIFDGAKEKIVSAFHAIKEKFPHKAQQAAETVENVAEEIAE